MTLDEIKQAIVERIDAAWEDVKDHTDADAVRIYVQGLTAELVSHVYAVEAQLVNHVLAKQDPAPAPEPSAPAATGPEDGAPAATTPADTGWNAPAAPAADAEQAPDTAADAPA